MHAHRLKKIYERSSILFLVTAFFFITVSYAFGAAEYTPLIGLPGITDVKTATLPQYVNSVYITLIGLGSLIAVMRIAWIGTKYSMSESVVHKVDAKSEIIGVLTGLAILLIPFIVLNTINPELTSLDVLKRAEKMEFGVASEPGTCEGSDGQQHPVGSGLCAVDSLSSDPSIVSCESNPTRYWDASTDPASCKQKNLDAAISASLCTGAGGVITGSTCALPLTGSASQQSRTCAGYKGTYTAATPPATSGTCTGIGVTDISR